MQPLILANLGPEGQRLLEEIAKFSPGDYVRLVAMMTALSVVCFIFACWVASHLVAKETASFSRALKTTIILILSFLLIGAIVGGALVVAARQGSAAMLTAIPWIGLILGLYAALNVPMKVYEIRAGAALGFILITFVVQAAAQLALVRFASEPLGLRVPTELAQKLAALPADQRQLVVESLRAKKSAAPSGTPAPVIDRGPSIAERQAELTKRYGELQARREALQPGDQAGVDAYMRDNAIYVQLLEQLQKDAAAASAP